MQEISDCPLLYVELAMSMRHVYVAGILASRILGCSDSNAFEPLFEKVGCVCDWGFAKFTDRMTTKLKFCIVFCCLLTEFNRFKT